MRVSVTVSVPELSTPPPIANAHWAKATDPHGAGSSNVAFGAAPLPVITLSAIATVAPDSIRIPPPAANAGPGLESFRPPVIVTRLIETVWLLTPSPTVTTGPAARVSGARAA